VRIAIDLTAVRTTGMRNYLRGFLPALARVGGGRKFLVFVPPGEFDDVTSALPPEFETHAVAGARSTPARLFWQQVRLPLALTRNDVLFAPFDIAPLAAPCPMLLAVRNPSPIMAQHSHRPPTLRAAVRARLQRLVSRASAQRARLVMYPSSYAASALGDVVGVDPAKRRVVYHGSDVGYWSTKGDESSLATYGVRSGEYLLFVSNLYRSKRPNTLIDAFAEYVRQSNDTSLRLLFVGSLDDVEFKRELNESVARHGLGERVRFLGHIPREHVLALYQHCLLFVLPTLVETFGFPFVEAMASGAAVVAADTALAREICGRAAAFFPPDDAPALAGTISSLIADKAERARLSQAGRIEAERFGWQLEAKGTLDLLLAVARPGSALLPSLNAAQ
jgi:glycosyltransferase involved in cell wall biosynthesis